jgi:hypothetical protein
MLWREDFSGAACLSIAPDEFDEEDYIRELTDFDTRQL